MLSSVRAAELLILFQAACTGLVDATNGDAGQPGSAGNGNGSCTAPHTEFPASATIYQDISNAPIDSAWANGSITGVLANGWGNAFQLDPSFSINYADSCTVRRTFTQPSDALPDCDTAAIPVPSGGTIEGSSDYACDGDCHLLTYQNDRLYELYEANITGGKANGETFSGACLVVWDLTHDYWQPGTPFSRGDGCNGADAADLPIAALLLKKEEIAALAVNHAMRFTIANPKIDNMYYVHPTTHLGGKGPANAALPYGARLRLRADYPVASLPSAEARAIAVALQKYGMFLADGGNFYVSATGDITDVIDVHDLKALQPSDFDMVDGGTRYDFHKQNCDRTPITD